MNVNVKKYERKLANNVLKKMYQGDGLYVAIDEMNVIYDESDGKPMVELKGRYGRYTADGNNNFQHNFTLDLYHSKNYNFVSGMFYQIVCAYETE